MRVRYQSRHKEEEDGGNETEASDYAARKRKKLVESSTRRLPQKKNNKETQIVVYKRRSPNQFIDRWSTESFSQPHTKTRVEVRGEEAHWRHGSVDHLLKHMSGKVAPGCQDRFMRKHNADGAMEYWLESSDLVHIRKEAGVNDPFWTPPPGWKLGDSPTQDPICVGEIRDIRGELDILKRELEKLASKKDEELAIMMNTPISCVTSQNVDHDNMMPLANEIYTDLLKKKDKIEDQLVTIAEALHKMEEDMGCLRRTVDGNCPRKPDSTEMPLLLEDSPIMKTLEGEVNRENQIKELPQKGRRDERPLLSLKNNTGFRICRPVASFSWPNLPALAAATDNDEIASLPSHHRLSPSLTCPVKPLAAKRPLVLPFPFTATPQDQAPTDLFNL